MECVVFTQQLYIYLRAESNDQTQQDESSTIIGTYLMYVWSRSNMAQYRRHRYHESQSSLWSRLGD